MEQKPEQEFGLILWGDTGDSEQLQILPKDGTASLILTFPGNALQRRSPRPSPQGNTEYSRFSPCELVLLEASQIFNVIFPPTVPGMWKCVTCLWYLHVEQMNGVSKFP